MMATDDRCDNDFEGYSREERDDLQAALDKVDDARDTLALEVGAAFRKFGMAVLDADPRFFLFFNSGSKQTERGHEGVQGAVEFAQRVASELAGDMLDREEIDRAEGIVETGHD